ncbi:hypothetical protein J6590_056410 [Homalodisca vitripennis]|nr:hypothetical protein J6590_056410 [Homalodisca vitripennis]
MVRHALPEAKLQTKARALYGVCAVWRGECLDTASIVSNNLGTPNKLVRLISSSSKGQPIANHLSLKGLLRIPEVYHEGVPIAERIKTLDFGSELEIAQVQILSVTVALVISTIDLVLYRLSPLFCLIRSSHRPVAHEDGQNKT